MDDKEKFGADPNNNPEEESHEGEENRNPKPGSTDGEDGTRDGGNPPPRPGSKRHNGGKGRKPKGDQSDKEVPAEMMGEMSFEQKSTTATKGGYVLQTNADSNTVRAHEAATVSEMSTGRRYVDKFTPKKTAYVTDSRTGLVPSTLDIGANIRKTNAPITSYSTPATMHEFDALEEQVALVTVPIAGEAGGDNYPKNEKRNENNSASIIDTDSVAIKGGQFLGLSATVSQGLFTEISLADMTPSSFIDDGDITVDRTDFYMKTSANATLHYREAELMKRNMEKVESKREHTQTQNPIKNSPQTEEWLRLNMDIIRDTTHTIERAFVCCNQFMANIGQERYTYGTDVNYGFSRFFNPVSCILGLKADDKKVVNTVQLTSAKWLTSIISDAEAIITASMDRLYVYPKTSIAYKNHLQELLSWSKPNGDHRSPFERCNLAFTTAFGYSDVTYLDGVKMEGNTLGEKNPHRYWAKKNNDVEPGNYYTSPIFKGIEDMLHKSLMTSKSNSVLVKSGKSTTFPLTFDPAFPTFAFLILKSVGHIIDVMGDMCTDFYAYIEEDTSRRVSSFVPYKFKNLQDWLDKAGYSSAHWHSYDKGRMVKNPDYVNWRHRFPETSHIVVEDSNDAKSMYSYYADIISSKTLRIVDGVMTIQGNFNVPNGRFTLDPEYFLTVLDPVIVPRHISTRSQGAVISLQFGGEYDPRLGTSFIRLDPVTVSDWMKSRRLTGLIYSIPTCLSNSDPNLISIDQDSNYSGLIPTSNVKDVLATKLCASDFSKAHDKATAGCQLSTYRMHFPIAYNEFAAAHVFVGNIRHDDEYLRTCITKAVNMGSGYEAKGFITSFVKGTKGSLTTNAGVTNFVPLPCSGSTVMGDYGIYSNVNLWSVAAPFLLKWSNPFISIRETTTTGKDDAEILSAELVPHQISMNRVFFWEEASAEEYLEYEKSRLENEGNDIIEARAFNL